MGAFINGFIGVFVVLLLLFAFSVHPALLWGTVTGMVFIVMLGIWNSITGGKGIKDDESNLPLREDLNDEDRHHH